jgi:hypothetical protein
MIMSERTESGIAAEVGNKDATVASKLAQVDDQARQAAAKAATHAQDFADDASRRASSLAGDVKDHLTSVATDGKDGLADQLEDVADAVQRSGEQLEGHQDWLAHLVERGAHELGSLASTLRTNDLQGLLGNLQDLARRQPAVFVGASLAAGFAMVRVGKVAVSGLPRADLPQTPEVNREPK